MFSSACRGQVEPLPALVALAVFAASLSVYAMTLHAVPLEGERTVDDATVTRVLETTRDGTVVNPNRLSAVETNPASGTTVSVVLRADGRIWRIGPTPPDSAPSTTREVLVRTSDGAVPGRMRVSTWP